MHDGETVTVTVELESDLIERIDERAGHRLGVDRSDVVSEELAAWLRRQ